MKKTLLILAGLLLLVSISMAESNRCSFNSFERVGDSRSNIAIEINITNHDTLAGFQIPFSYMDDNLDLVCDSISFINSRCAGFDALDAQIDNESKSALIMGIYQTNPAVDKQPLLPGRGLIARAYFTINDIDDRRIQGKKQLRFIKKRFTNNAAILDFSFWKPDGESVDAIYENNVFELDSDNQSSPE